MFKKDQRAAVKTRLSIHVESDCSASTEPSAADVTAELNVSSHVLIQSDLNIYTTVSRYRFNYMVNAHVHAYATIQKMWEALSEASKEKYTSQADGAKIAHKQKKLQLATAAQVLVILTAPHQGPARRRVSPM